MQSKVFFSKSPKDQETVVKSILELVDNTPIVLFVGEMGTGKTTLIKNICNFLNVKDDVSSPTFSLVNEYETETGEIVYHFDFYRIEREEEALDMGCEDYFYSNNICLIESPAKVENILPLKHILVEITVENKQRKITVSLV